jgi:outer membrane lipoprotein-sorting protein
MLIARRNAPGLLCLRLAFAVLLTVLAIAPWGAARADGTPAASEIVAKMLDADPWGLAGADVAAHLVITDTQGHTRKLAFTARSRRYAPRLSKSLVRFREPSDLAGTGFLQIQRADGDDERYLYLPELHRSRRIAGGNRKSSFVGTDFTYADLDRRDLRDAAATLIGRETLGKYDVYHVELIPRQNDGPYSKIAVWVRADNFVPLKSIMFSASGTMLKTLVTEEVKKIGERWFISRSRMTSHADQRSTELTLDSVTPADDIPDDEFTVRNLEKS